MKNFRWRYLKSAARMWRHNRVQAMLCVLGVVAGVSGLVTVVAVGNGAKQELEQAIGLMGAGTMVVRSIVESEHDRRITTDRMAAVQRLMGRSLQHMVPVSTVQRSVLAGENYLDGVKIVGTDRDYEGAYQLRLHRGRFVTWFDIEHRERVVVLGSALVRELFPRGEAIGQQVRIGRHWYTVVGWLQADRRATITVDGFDMPDIDRVAYVPLTTIATERENIPLDELVLQFADEENMIKASGAVQRILEYDADGAAFEYTMPIELLRQKLRMQRVIQYLLAGATAVMLLVGGIGIMNIMLVNVLRRRSEIGLRRAVGASRRDILAQFVTESTMVALVGGIAGVIVGSAAAHAVAWWVDWPVSVGLNAVFLGLLVSVLVGVCFGSYPAMQAASVAPIRTLNNT